MADPEQIIGPVLPLFARPVRRPPVDRLPQLLAEKPPAVRKRRQLVARDPIPVLLGANDRSYGLQHPAKLLVQEHTDLGLGRPVTGPLQSRMPDIALEQIGLPADIRF